MKPAEQGVQLERHNYPLNSICMDLDSAIGVFARRTGASFPNEAAAGARRSHGQEMPRSPASRQAGQPGDRQSRGWCEEGGAGHPWAAGACWREGWAEREPEARAGTSRAGIKQKLVVYRMLELPSITAVGAPVATAA